MTVHEEPENRGSLENRLDNFSNSKISDIFVDFLKSQKGTNGELKYRQRVSALFPAGKSLVVDFSDLASFDIDLAVKILQEPRKFLKIFDNALFETLAVEAQRYADRKVHVRIRDLPEKTSLRELDSSHLSKMTMVSGIITKIHQVRSIAVNAAFHCNAGHLNFVRQDFSESSLLCKPWTCSGESDTGIPCAMLAFRFDRKLTEWSDYQNVTIQEMPEDLPAGDIPRQFEVLLFDDIVDAARPGDRVSLTCIMETVNLRDSTRGLSQISENRLFANHIEIIGRRPEDQQISKEEEAAFREFAKQPGAYDKLVQSFDPAIFGFENVKESILLQLVGSPQRSLPDGTTLRGDISILLVGDPGIAKSQLLKFSINSSPRGFYTTGMNSSIAGLGAAVIREPNGVLALAAGAAVLTDLGILAIDELGQLSRENMAVLNEVMEQQSVSISKAGINVNLNARTSILAAMNPVDGKYDAYKNIVDNIGIIPIPLLTRFDLIFILLDQPDEEKDSSIGRHIAYIRKNKALPTAPPVTHEFLRRYVIFAKKLDPELTEEAVERLLSYYTKLRRESSSDGLSVTPRFYESLIRLTIARARLLLHERTTEDDAIRAINITEVMLRRVATDKETKKLDVGLLYNKPISEKGLREAALETFRRLSGERKDPVEDKTFYQEMEKTTKFTSEQAEKVFQDMWKSGVIFEVEAHYFKKA